MGKRTVSSFRSASFFRSQESFLDVHLPRVLGVYSRVGNPSFSHHGKAASSPFKDYLLRVGGQFFVVVRRSHFIDFSVRDITQISLLPTKDLGRRLRRRLCIRRRRRRQFLENKKKKVEKLKRRFISIFFSFRSGGSSPPVKAAAACSNSSSRRSSAISSCVQQQQQQFAAFPRDLRNFSDFANRRQQTGEEGGPAAADVAAAA